MVGLRQPNFLGFGGSLEFRCASFSTPCGFLVGHPKPLLVPKVRQSTCVGDRSFKIFLAILADQNLINCSRFHS